MDFLCGNFNIYDRKMFETKEWKQYLNEFNSVNTWLVYVSFLLGLDIVQIKILLLQRF